MKKLIILFMILMCMPFVLGNLADDLISYYSFNNENGEDSLNNFTLSNNVDYPVTFIDGMNGKGAISNNTYGILENDTFIDVDDYNDGLSFSMWVYIDDWTHCHIDASPNFGCAFYHIPESGAWGGYTLEISNTGKLLASFGNGVTSNGGRYSNIFQFSKYQWYHVVSIHNGTNSKVYVDNVKKLDVTSGNLANNDVRFEVFGSYSGGYVTSKYGSWIEDELAVWGKALTETEIENLYNDGDGLVYPFVFPLLSINSPVNNTGINDNTLINFSIINFNNTNCSFLINGDIKENLFNINDGNYSFNFTPEYWINGTNNIIISCDGTNKTLSLFVDVLSPYYNYINVVENGINFALNNSLIAENFNFNFSVSDDNLFCLNVSIYNNSELTNLEFYNYTENIGSSNYLFTNYMGIGNFSGKDHYTFIEICDGHTDTSIKDLPIISKSNSIKVGNIEILSEDAEIKSIDAVKQFDRYNIVADYTESKELINYKLKSDDPLILVKNSRYMAHFVSKKSWVDFQNNNYDVDSINKISNFEYDIVLKRKVSKFSDSKITFNSVGVINCRNQTYYSQIENTIPIINVTNPQNNFYFVVNNSYYNLNVSYLVQSNFNYDNCSLFIDDKTFREENLKETKANISSNMEQQFNFSLLPFVQYNQTYNITIECQKKYTGQIKTISKEIEINGYNKDRAFVSLVYPENNSIVYYTGNYTYINLTYYQHLGDRINGCEFYFGDSFMGTVHNPLIDTPILFNQVFYPGNSSNVSYHANCWHDATATPKYSSGVNTFTITKTTTTTTTTTTRYQPFECQYNTNPYIKEKIIGSDRDKIKWICSFSDTYPKKCLTSISRNGELVQTNPQPIIIENVGIIDYFEGSGFISAYFDSTDLVPDFKYNFSVLCYDELNNETSQYITEITPTNKNLGDYVLPRTIYFKEGATAFVLLVLLLSILVYVIRVVRK